MTANGGMCAGLFLAQPKSPVHSRRGIPVTMVAALIAQLCVRHKLTLMTTGKDFARIATKHDLVVVGP